MTNTLGWVLQGILCAAFLLAGSMKLLQTKDKVIASGGKWAEDFSQPAIRVIGVFEVIFAVGVLVPQFLAPESHLVTGAAIGIMAVMAGAFFTHLRRKEPPFMVITAILFLMAGGVACLHCCQSTAA